MAHMQVIVDGETTFEGDVDDVVLPTSPQMYPDALRMRPGVPPTPLARIAMLTALVELLRRTLESPMLQPIEVEVQTHGMGKVTMAVDMRMPSGQGQPT